MNGREITVGHTPSPAEADAHSTSAEVGDIIVTANKREQSINSVGLTITALSGAINYIAAKPTDSQL